jgi:hypothetical protein
VENKKKDSMSLNLQAPQIILLLIYLFIYICAVVKGIDEYKNSNSESIAYIISVTTLQLIILSLLYWGGFFT